MSHLPLAQAYPAYANHLQGTWQFNRLLGHAPGAPPGWVTPPTLTFGALLGEIHVADSRRSAYVAGFLLYRPLWENLSYTRLVANPNPPPAQIEVQVHEGVPDPDRVYVIQISGTPPNHAFHSGASGILFVESMELWWAFTPGGTSHVYTKVS